MISVLHEELEYKVEKLKYKAIGGHAAEDQKQIQLVKKPSWISPHEVVQSWLINTVQHLLVKNDKKEGGSGGGGVINFLALKTGGGLLERGALNRGVTVFVYFA